MAIAAIFALVGGGHVAHMVASHEARLDAQTINVSGRQRMLSQRILHLAQDYHRTGAADSKRLLREGLALFTTSHEWLTALDDLSPAARAHYFGAGGLDAASRRYVADAAGALAAPAGSQAGAASVARLKDQALVDLLAKLDQAVTIFEADARERSARLTRIQNGSLVLALAILLVEAGLIFWPAQVSVNRSLDELERRNGELKDQTARLKEATRKLRFSASHDSLTGLANRKTLHEELGRRLAEVRHDDRQLCLMHIDLDRFKEVNDTLGHPVGDGVLCRVAEIMRDSVRTDDVVARVGGDEFVILIAFPRADGDETARAFAEGLIERLSARMEVGGHGFRIGASIGIAFAPGIEDASVLIGNADIALYESKRGGRGVATPFLWDMREALERRHTLMRDLERALVAGEFVAYLQPQVAFADGRVTGFEVLARWRHPERGVVGPDAFIGLGEEMGLIDAIDDQVTCAGLDLLADLRRAGHAAPAISINASGRSLRTESYVERLIWALSERGLAPADVVVEVVESTLIASHSDGAACNVRALVERGFEVQIDDFGTGYASLAVLSTLDLKGLKIDRSLTGDLGDMRSVQIVEAVISLARVLDLRVTAEGVETDRQFAMLKRMGCDVAQGFGIARPMPAGEVSGWLAAHAERRRDRGALGGLPGALSG